MQSSARLMILASLVIASLDYNSAEAQMFGGSPPARVPNTGIPNNPGAGGGAGTAISSGAQNSLGISRPAQGTDRFLRQNRAPRDFVGRSRADINSFIGAQQALAVGQVRPATEGLRSDNSTARRVNSPIPPQPKKGIYYPKLELDLNVDNNAVGNEPSREVDSVLMNRLRKTGGPSVQINLAGTTATLMGQVDSARTAELVERLLSFEPGVDNIINRLSVATREN